MKMRKCHIDLLLFLFILLPAAGLCACGHRVVGQENGYAADMSELREKLCDVVRKLPGEVGIAVILDSGDTLTVNNFDIYPLMSVFKLHQAVALCHELEKTGIAIDSAVGIDRHSLNPDTWSPMLKDYTEESFNLSISDLMRYTLAQSDNNASNLMFNRFVNVEATDSFISTLIPRQGFRLRWKEEEMQAEHARSYDNHSSPFATALLLNKLFTDSVLDADSQHFICDVLLNCTTGKDRISAPLADKDGVRVAHKTGSGYVNDRGELIAHNDAAFVQLPDSRHYTLVVFVRDFAGDEQEASAAISSISAMTYDFITNVLNR